MANRLAGFLLVGLSIGFAACGGDSLTLPPSSGTLQVTTATDGSEPDPDGYILQVDALQPQSIGASATTSVEQLAPGTHNVVLTGMAPNCSVVGDNPRSVTITVGETTTAAFELTCGGTTGALEITTQTNGPVSDADGYNISFDGSDRGLIGASATVTLSNLPAGSHVVGLTGVAANCQVQGDNLKAVTIAPGATATLTFTVSCAQPPPVVGILRITTSTNGQDPDGNGYRFAVDGAEPQGIGINNTTDLANTAVGSHTVVLSNVADNCAVDDASKSATVPPGGMATVTFNITCGSNTGSIRVTTTTAGSNIDPNGYQFSVDGGANQPIGVDDVKTVADVPAGSHTVVLSDLASNCSVTGGASKNVRVTAGATSEVGFSVTCQKASTTTTMTDDPDPSTTGQPVTVTVTVSSGSGTPTGTVDVTVKNNPDAHCTITLAEGTGSCQLTGLLTGDDQTFFANYRGDGQFAVSSTAVQHQVDPAPNPSPVAVFDAPTGCTAGFACLFDGTQSTDDGSITDWSWDFGELPVGDTGSGSNPSYTYSVAGSYSVTLTVTDNLDATNTISHDVTVN
jgi:PKD domain-containing protein/Big-like domain-containing protein